MKEFYLRRILSSFPEAHFLAFFLRAGVEAHCEPTQSPSGRMWPATQIVRLARMPSMMRSMILACGFIGQIRMTQISSFAGRSFFELFDDLEHAISAHYRIVHDKAQRGSVLQNDRPGHQTLEAFSVTGQQSEAPLLLLGVAENTDKDHCGMQIPRDIHVIDRDQAGLADFKLAADSFPDLALEQFAHPLHAEGSHFFFCRIVKALRR